LLSGDIELNTNYVREGAIIRADGSKLNPVFETLTVATKVGHHGRTVRTASKRVANDAKTVLILKIP